ncbi:MAG: sulfite exporter TauE/SafE family protein, partial [Chitinophagales bacterium]|nr:sulfite exporter TauE/SafE family protein [Chitinophagales bacterium]
MEIQEVAIILAAGFFAGFINTVAGGGSLITLPVLIFMGLPPSIANASNRVAIFFQNAFATGGFASKGVSVFPYNIYLGISALFGAIIGAKLAIDIDGALFNRILAGIMIMVVFFTVFNPVKGKDVLSTALETKHKWLG